jgi:HD-GYP domain-containing protein (c-di-GMP phosphodiesterase class II)
MLRLLGLLGGLSVATDLGTGAPLEASLKRCVLAARLARAAGCADADAHDVVYVSLLQHLGCTAYSHEVADAFGDDIAAIHAGFLTNWTDSRDLFRTFVPHVAAATGRSKARVLATMAKSGPRVDRDGPAATCEVARDAARRLNLPGSVQECLFHVQSRWDGEGYPATAGQDIPFATRVMQVASVATLFCVPAGPDRALEEVRRRSGSYLDPDVGACLTRDLMEDLADLDAYDDVLASEPDPARLVDPGAVAHVTQTFGDIVDLKSPWLHGHSSAVADLAAEAAQTLGSGPAEVSTIRIAGHLHDLGRIGVSSRIWDKSGPLSTAERAQVDLHPWHTEQILARVPALAEAALIAGQHHERLDGSGYHRRAMAAQLAMPSRVLAASDRYRTLVEDRPHRPAAAPAEAASALQADVRSGGLDGDAVAAVLEAAGHLRTVRRARPAGLTARQVDVLRLLAAGRSNREIARDLVISHRTAEHHVQDIYTRIGTSTRAGAALFAMEHGLLSKPG